MRIKWIDVARFYAIWAVFIGHYAMAAGHAYTFVFMFHVTLFFFLSGCTETFSKDVSLGEYILKKAKQVLLPALFFIFVYDLLELVRGASFEGFFLFLWRSVLWGAIRNDPYSGGLWFFTCLFGIQVLFRLVRMVQKKWLMVSAPLVLLVLAEFFLPSRPVLDPKCYWNVDSVCYYLFFYAMGYLLYPSLSRLFALDSRRKKTVFGVSFLLAGVFAISVYGTKDFTAILHPICPEWICQIYNSVILPSVLVFFFCMLSKLTENVTSFEAIGKNTLYLYGSEFPVKFVMMEFLSTLGLAIQTVTPLGTIAYSLFLVYITNRYLVPKEAAIIKWILDKMHRSSPERVLKSER